MLIPDLKWSGIFYLCGVKLFTDIPFLRILIPLLVGIIPGIYTSIPIASYTACFLCLAAVLVCLPFKKRKNIRYIFLFFCDVFLIVYGVLLVSKKNLSKDENFYGHFIHPDSSSTIIGIVDDIPVTKPKSFKLPLRVFAIKTNGVFRHVKGNVLVYIRKSLKTNQLKTGDALMIQTRLKEVPIPANPSEFNYRQYLCDKQIYHTAFVDSNALMVVEKFKETSVWTFGLWCKTWLLKRIKHASLSSSSYAICAALLTGYDDDVEKPVMDAFSRSGTLHVLSVSGLHVGLIYLLMNFLFNFFDSKNKYRNFRFIVITLVLWGFALMTGFSAPVLRSAIMFSLMGIGKLYFRNHRRNQMNILLLSAFIMLCYNPFYVRDIGFLLSYFAMAGLFYLQPLLAMNIQPDNVLLKYIWESFTASMAATISTLPVTLYYFKQFPVWFLITNLVVVPVTSLLLCLTLLLIIKASLAAPVINALNGALMRFISLFNSESSYIGNIHFEWSDLLCLSILLVAVLSFLHSRSYRLGQVTLLMLICWQFFCLLSSWQIKRNSVFTVYHLQKSYAYSIKSGTSVSLVYLQPRDYDHHIRPHLNSFNYPSVDSTSFNFISNNEVNVLIANKTITFQHLDRGLVHVIVLSNDIQLPESELANYRSLRLVVVDGSNNIQTVQRTEKLCRKFGIGFYNTAVNGAYALPL